MRNPTEFAEKGRCTHDEVIHLKFLLIKNQ